jgi:two-component system, OmpR family, response regulator
MAKVLLIDDDEELVEMLTEYLEQDGFSVQTAHDGEQGLMAALSIRPDIVVLDVMMPRLNGVETLRRLRQESQMPVLMLTARGDDTDRILGLELGADDYVPKPCTPRELSARIRAILRRTQTAVTENSTPVHLVAGALEMWPQRRVVHWAGQPVDLTSTEFNLLEVLLRNSGKTVSKAELSEKALGRPLARFDRNIDVHMSSLRHKLGTLPDGRSCIQTVHRQGYIVVKE